MTSSGAPASEPAFLVPHMGRFPPVARSNLADGRAEVVANGAFGEVEPGGDVGRGVVCRRGGEHLVLPRRQGALSLGERGCCKRRVDRPATRGDGANRCGKLARGGVLEEKPAGALRERAAHVPGAAEGGEDERARLRQLPGELARG